MREVKKVYLNNERKEVSKEEATIEAIRIFENGKLIKEAFGVIDQNA